MGNYCKIMGYVGDFIIKKPWGRGDFIISTWKKGNAPHHSAMDIFGHHRPWLRSHQISW
jgi:hypothetical protein